MAYSNNYGGGGGGYSTTGYGAQGGADGGGFLNGSQGGSQDSPGGSKAYGKDTLRPVTIKQLIDATQPHPSAEFKIDGQEITQVSFVGQVRSISSQATNTTYKLDDGTGLIEVKQWIDADANPEGAKTSDIREDGYIRVWGRIKAFNDKRHVFAQVLRPVADPMEIQYHLLDATYVHLYYTRGPPESIQSGANGGDNNGMFVDQGAGVKQNSSGNYQLPSMSANARRVYSTLQNSPQNNEGLHVAMLASQLGMAQADVYKAGDELLGLGIIYTTVDDETWAVLEL